MQFARTRRLQRLGYLGEAPSWFTDARNYLATLSKNQWYEFQVRDRGWAPFSPNEFVSGVWRVTLPGGKTIWAWRSTYQQGPKSVTKVASGARPDAYPLNLGYVWFGDLKLDTSRTGVQPLSQPPADYVSENPPGNVGTSNIDTGFNYRKEGLGPTIALAAPLALAAGAALFGAGAATEGGVGLSTGESLVAGSGGVTLPTAGEAIGAGAIAPGAEAAASGATGGILTGSGASLAPAATGGSLLSTGTTVLKTASGALSAAQQAQKLYQAAAAAAGSGQQAQPAYAAGAGTGTAPASTSFFSGTGGNMLLLGIVALLGFALLSGKHRKKAS